MKNYLTLCIQSLIFFFVGLSGSSAQSNDAGVISIAPEFTCPGSQPVAVQVQNFGDNQIDSVEVNWTLNGIAQPTVKEIALIDTAGGSNSDVITIALGSVTFGPGPDLIEAWTSSPNGLADPVSANDSLNVTREIGLTGNLTIGPVGDYVDFSSAVADLISRGICGAVQFDIAAGTYNESINIPAITGSSSTNTITFLGAATQTVVISSSTNAVPTVRFTGADYVTFSTMTIMHTGTADVWAVHLSGASDHNTITNCAINVPVTTTTDFAGIVASNSLTFESSEGNNANYLTITNNTITGGERGVHLEGAATENVGNFIDNNHFEAHDDVVISVDEQDSLTITNNTMQNMAGVGTDGLFLTDTRAVLISRNSIDVPDNGMDLNDINDFEISYNVINAEDFGMDVDDANDIVTPISASKVFNNMVRVRDLAAMSWDDSESLDIYHNTVYGNPGMHFNDNDNMNLVNNIMVADADYALEIDDATASEWNTLNHNVYHNDGGEDLLQFSSDYVDLADWRAGVAALQQPQSLEGPVSFFSNNDLHVIGGIPDDNGASGLGINDDIDGDARPFAPSTSVDIGADEFLQVATDVGVISINSLPCSGANDLIVSIRNYGTNVLTSVTVNWNLDDGIAPITGSQTFTGMSLQSAADTVLNVATVNYTGSSYNQVVYTSDPNGVADGQTSNDTVNDQNVLVALSGTFSIGTTGDYVTFTEAANDLNNKGVCGPVVFNVAAETFSEFIQLNEIKGASSINTVTFIGVDAATSVITSDSNAVPTIRLRGSDYVTFRNLGISHLGTADGWGVHLSNGADHNTIDSCVIILPISTATDFAGVVASASTLGESTEGNNANYLTVSNNIIRGGERGVHLEGAVIENVGNRVLDNLIEFIDDVGISVDEQDSLTVEGNTVRNINNPGGDGFQLFDTRATVIKSNTIDAPDMGMDLNDINDFELSYNSIIARSFGIDVDDANDLVTPTNRSSVVNNMVSTLNNAGMSWDDAESINLYHNTVYGNPGMQFNDNDEMNLANNILVADRDFALEIDDATASEWDSINYNLYFNNGATDLLEFGTTGYTDLPAWQAGVAAFPQPFSLEGDPNFFSIRDLHIKAGPASDAGASWVGILDDIDGDVRPFAPSTTVDIGADEYLQINDDAGALAINSLPCPGPSDIFATITNFGNNVLSSVTVDWNFDDGVAPIIGSQSFTGMNLQTGEDTVLLLTNANFTSPLYSFTIYTSLPNGVVDAKSSNDTLIRDNLQIALSGNYTIGPAGDYIDFSAAALDLNLRGVCGPVVITASAGTYNDSILLNEIEGVSAVNTITFQGVDAATTILTSSGNTIPTVTLNGTDYTTFKKLTISNTGTTDAWGIRLRNAADRNLIDSCIFPMNVGTGADVMAITASDNIFTEAGVGNNANYLTISNNVISGGERGIHLQGPTGSANTGNRILNNLLSQHSSIGISIDQQDSVTIEENVINNLTGTGADGFDLDDLSNAIIRSNEIDVPDNGMDIDNIRDFELSYNQIIAEDFGIDIDDANDNYVPAAHSRVFNNMVLVEDLAGMSWDDSEDMDVYHNTIKGNPAIHFNDNNNMNLVNNILVADDDFALEIDDATASEWDSINHNLYFNDGTNDLLEFGTTGYTDLAAWQAAVTAFPQPFSVQGDPLFLGPEDLHVRGILANDAGANWVGIADDIDGDARPNGVNVDIGADEFSAALNDLGMVDIFPLAYCGDSNQIVQVVVTNTGVNPQSNVSVTLEASGAVTGILTGTITGPLNQLELDTISLSPGLNTINGGEIQLKAYHQLNPDDFDFDDTLEVTYAPGGSPQIIARDTSVCVADSAVLWAQMTRPTVVFWYETNDLVADTIPLAIDTLVTGALSFDTAFYVTAGDPIGVRIVEFDRGTPDGLEIQNLSDAPIDVTDWEIVISASYTDQNNFNANTQILNGNLNPGEVISFHDDPTQPANFWGNNMFWNGTNPGYIILLNDVGEVVDFVTWSWESRVIHTINFTVNGTNVNISPIEWTLDGIEDGDAWARTPRDHNSAGDWESLASSTIGTINANLTDPVLNCIPPRVRFEVNMVPEPLVSFTFSVNQGEVTFTNTTDVVPEHGPYTYEWDFGDGNNSTAENPVHTYAANGNYVVRLIARNKCEESTFVTPVDITTIGIEELSASQIDVYPNPSRGIVTIEMPYQNEEVMVAVHSIDGKEVMKTNLVSVSNNGAFKKSIDISSLERGLYFINISLDGSTYTKRIILADE